MQAGLFEYDGRTIRVECREASHLRWLEEFLAPPFGVGAAEAAPGADCTVRLTVDAEAFERVRRAGPGAGEIDAFALDSQVVRLPLRAADAGETLAHDPGFDVFYRARASGPEFEILGAPGNARLRTPLLRVVRELAMNHSQNKGGLFLHASAFAVGGEAVIAAGPKHSGKTSLLTHALHADGVAYLANDRVLASVEGEGVALRGMPVIVTLRKDMLARFPKLHARLRARAYDHRASLAELREAERRGADGPTRAWSDGRTGLSPAQYCALLETRPAARARARALLFPRTTGQPGGVDLEPLAPEAAAARLSEALFGVRSWRKTSDLFRLRSDGEPPDEASLAGACLELTRRVRCYECRLGRGAYASPDGPRRLIEAVFGS